MKFEEILDNVAVNRNKFEETWEKICENTNKIKELESSIDNYNKILDSYNSDISAIKENNKNTIEKFGANESFDMDEQENLISQYKDSIAKKIIDLNLYNDIILSKEEDNYIVLKYFISYVKEKYCNLIENAKAHQNEISQNAESVNENFAKLGLNQSSDMMAKIAEGVFPEEKDKKKYINFLTVADFIIKDPGDAYLRLGFFELNNQKKAYAKVCGKNGDPNSIADNDLYNIYKKFELDLYIANNKVEDEKKEITRLENQINDNVERVKDVKKENAKFSEELSGKTNDINTISQKIKQINNDLAILKNDNEELLKVAKELNDQVFNEKELKESDIDGHSEKKHGENDVITPQVYVGITPLTYILDGIEPLNSIQPYFIKTDKPFFLVFDGADKEAKETTGLFYRIIDNMLVYVTTHMYNQGFKFEIIDNKMAQRVAMENMPRVGRGLTEFINAEMVNYITGRDYSEFERIVNAKNEELSNFGAMNIIDANEKQKESDKIVKYTFLCMRVYSSNDLKFENVNSLLTNCNGCGIFPFIFISKELFEENKASFELSIKELCKKKYYTITINKDTARFINITEEKI